MEQFTQPAPAQLRWWLGQAKEQLWSLLGIHTSSFSQWQVRVHKKNIQCWPTSQSEEVCAQLFPQIVIYILQTNVAARQEVTLGLLTSRFISLLGYWKIYQLLDLPGCHHISCNRGTDNSITVWKHNSDMLCMSLQKQKRYALGCSNNFLLSLQPLPLMWETQVEFRALSCGQAQPQPLLQFVE